MTPIILYAAKTIVCSCAFILLYMWQFHKKVHYKYCRIYLIATMLLSVLIPALNVPIYPNRALQVQTDVQYVGDATVSASETTTTDRAATTYFEPSVSVAPTSANTETATATATAPIKKTNWKSIGLIIYLSFIAVTLLLTIRSLLKIWRLRAESELIARQDFSIAKNNNVKTPFTFFKTIFVGNNYTDDEWRQIISHEASHARHLHSVERMAMTLLRTLFWFNPFMWIAAKRLEEVQEWQADNDAIGDGYAIEQYRLTILHQIFGYTPDLSLGMSNSFTKNRFIMMTQKLNRKCTRPAVLAAAVAAGAFFAFGCTTQTFARNGQTLDSEAVASNNGDTMTFTREIPTYRKDTSHISITFYFDRFVGDDENEVDNNRYRSVSVGEKSIETVEYYRDGRKVCLAVASGVSEVRDPQSSELDWVNEKTSIFFDEHLIPFADFEKMRKNNAKATIHYLHLNSDMDFVYVYGTGWTLSHEKYRLYHPQSTFCKKLPDVAPVADIYSYGRDYVELELVDAKTNEISVLVVPNYADVFCIYDNFVSIGRFKSLPNLYYQKIFNPNITLYRNAAAKKRFGNEYDYVVEARPTFTVTEVDDLQLGTKLSEASFTVSKNNTKTFREFLSYGGTYYIQVGAKNPSLSGQVIAALTTSWGHYLGEIKRLKSDQSEIIIFRCDEVDYYNIEINSENGDEVDGIYTLWRKNE